MVSLSGKVIAVTGAGGGIGRALAIGLAHRGAKLALADRDAEGLAKTADSIGTSNVFTRDFDVTDHAAFALFLNDARDKFGALHGLINNAGLSVVGPFEQTPREDFARVMDVNFGALVEGCRVALPALRASGNDAWLVNISSIFGIMPFETQTSYCASKFAVRGFTETLRVELGQTAPKICVICVHPGGIKTNVLRNAKYLGSVSDDSASMMTADNFEKVAPSTPQQAAEQIIRAMERRKVRVRIGADARIVDWLVRLTPVRAPSILAALLRTITRFKVGKG
jgi:NAD(P)-dependent dehydrogenase (short-subunit alcohol dehydrogenase family)